MSAPGVPIVSQPYLIFDIVTRYCILNEMLAVSPAQLTMRINANIIPWLGSYMTSEGRREQPKENRCDPSPVSPASFHYRPPSALWLGSGNHAFL